MPPAVTWLIRHGESEANAGLPATGNSGTALTSLGHQQARDVADRIQRQPDLLITSPFRRAIDTGEPIRARWPLTRCEVWPIQEVTYLSAARCLGTTSETRRSWIDAYWRRCDPDYLDGPDAESFRSFVARLLQFHQQLLALDDGFVAVVGHGQFFSAYRYGQSHGFSVSPDWMDGYRAAETAGPMANCQIIELDGETLTRRPV